MANTYFQFKQFIIHQDKCAMKVCTDACILGAWFGAKLPASINILDIGSGTGLLIMMLAQNTAAEIDGIEIDLPAFKQLQENVHQNEWRKRIRVFPGDVRNFSFPHPYDFIITNPPFYENDLQSESTAEQTAKHSKDLRLDELLFAINRNLKSTGSFGILLPQHRVAEFQEKARKAGFYLSEKLSIRQTFQHPAFRSVMQFSKIPVRFAPEYELVIQSKDGGYTPEFTSLMKPYYLKL